MPSNPYTNTSISHINRQPSTTYYYKVTTINSAGQESEKSSYTSATTLSASVVTPAKPVISSVGLTPNESGLRISWNSVSNAAFYKIYTSNSKYGSYTNTATSYSTSYDDTSVNFSISGRGYYYQVTAVSSAGNESSRSEARGVTLPNAVSVCFYTPGAVTTSTSILAGRTVYNYRRYTGYRVTIGGIIYYDYYTPNGATTSADEPIAPGTYYFSTQYRSQAGRRFGNEATDWYGSHTLSSETVRPSLTLKLIYHYTIDAVTGVVTTSPVLQMD
jgi:cellulose 1,4-beta-cellobiosidase